MGPLEGIKVIELTGIGPGPFCAMMLGDMGADIVRIDRIGGHPSNIDPRKSVLDRSRRSVGVDLKSEPGIKVALRLIDQADALIEGFRPGVMERLGLGPETCISRNPRLVYGRVTGWGQYGALSQAAGHDINYLGITGALDAIGTTESGPVPPLNMLADFGGGGMLLTSGILAALLFARESGHGQVVDAAMSDGVPLLMGTAHTLAATGRWRGKRHQNLVDGGAYFYGTYQCADGKWIALGSIEPQFHDLLLEKLNLVSAPEFQNQYDCENWPKARARLAQVFLTQEQAHWRTLLENTDVCFAPVLSMEEAVQHPHNQDRNTFIEIEGAKQAAPAPRFSRTPSDIPSAPRLPGEDNDKVLTDWGFNQDEIAQFKANGVVG
ncbi:MAG: CaiB/BaiF CoA-transferase family protein [Pseudomonadota bacterium]|nr:CaiB/BaiF CoA-transferase family protein [Pseudomonadota bacterium]